MLVHPIREVITRTHLGTLATGIEGALFSRVRKSDCGSGRGFGFVIGYKNFATGTGNLKRKRKSQSLGIEHESISKNLPRNHGKLQARVHHPQKHPTRKQSVNQYKNEREELRMITYIDIFKVNSKKRGLSKYNKGLSPTSLKDDSCWTEFSG